MLPSEINARVENSFGAMLFVRICAHFMPEAFWSSHWALGRGFLWPEAFGMGISFLFLQLRKIIKINNHQKKLKNFLSAEGVWWVSTGCLEGV